MEILKGGNLLKMYEENLKNEKSQLNIKLSKLRKDRDAIMYLLSICNEYDITTLASKYKNLSSEINKIRDEIDDINNELSSISLK